MNSFFLVECSPKKDEENNVAERRLEKKED